MSLSLSKNGDGTATGATYDPNTHTLNFIHERRDEHDAASGPNSKPMKVEADQLAWNETTGMLLLLPWSRLTRDQTVVNAGQSTVVSEGQTHQTGSTRSTRTEPTSSRRGKSNTRPMPIHVELQRRASDG